MLVALIASMPTYPIVARGIILPMVPPPATPTPSTQPIALYNSQLSAPYPYQTLGWVNVEYHSATETEDAQKRVIKLAEKLARQQGGNAILVNEFGHTMSSVPKPLSIEILQGAIIKTNSINSLGG